MKTSQSAEVLGAKYKIESIRVNYTKRILNFLKFGRGHYNNNIKRNVEG
jgi:hypothetical protein